MKHGLIALTATLLAFPAGAEAQWGLSSNGVLEYDTNEVLFALLGVSASREGPGIQPVVSLQGYRLSYDAGPESVTVWSIRPAVGLKSGFDGGSLQAKVGYSIQDEDIDVPTGVFVPDPGVEEGVTLSGQAEYWGTGGPLGGQVLASYNFGSESFWGRVRGTTRIAQPAAGGQLRLGGEVALLNSDSFTAWQPGAVLEWHTPGGLVLIGGVGQKLYDVGEDATYFKAEFYLPLR